MNKITKRRVIKAHQLRDGMMADFDDGEPGMVSEVKHMVRSVLFKSRGDLYSVNCDDELVVVLRMQIVEN